MNDSELTEFFRKASIDFLKLAGWTDRHKIIRDIKNARTREKIKQGIYHAIELTGHRSKYPDNVFIYYFMYKMMLRGISKKAKINLKKAWGDI